MLELIFGNSTQQLLSKILTVATILISIYLFLYFFSQFKPVQSLFYGIVFFALVASGVMSFGNLNLYYQSKGGVIGEITSIFEKNQVEIIEEEKEINFNFSNVVLMKNANGKYSASITSDTLLKLDSNESYFIYVNDEPCTTVKCETKDIYATYSYVFMDRIDGEYRVLRDDVMTFYFALYDNYSYLYIEVENGEETSGLWNAYFNKNDFKVKISKVDNSFYTSQEYYRVRLHSHDYKLIKTVTLKPNTDYVLPELEYNGLVYKYWENSKLGIVSGTLNISENLDFYALDYIPVDLTQTSFASDIYSNWQEKTSAELVTSSFDFNITIENELLLKYLTNSNFSKIEIKLRSYAETVEFSNGVSVVGSSNQTENYFILTIMQNKSINSTTTLTARIEADDGSYKSISYNDSFSFNSYLAENSSLLINGTFNVLNCTQAFIEKHPNLSISTEIYSGLREIVSIETIKIYE